MNRNCLVRFVISKRTKKKKTSRYKKSEFQNSRFQQRRAVMNSIAYKRSPQWFTDHASTSRDSPQMKINRAEYDVLL